MGWTWSLQPTEEAPRLPRGAISYHSQRLHSQVPGAGGQRLQTDAWTQEKSSFQWPELEGRLRGTVLAFKVQNARSLLLCIQGKPACQTPPELQGVLPKPPVPFCLPHQPRRGWRSRGPSPGLAVRLNSPPITHMRACPAGPDLGTEARAP